MASDVKKIPQTIRLAIIQTRSYLVNAAKERRNAAELMQGHANESAKKAEEMEQSIAEIDEFLKDNPDDESFPTGNEPGAEAPAA